MFDHEIEAMFKSMQAAGVVAGGKRRFIKAMRSFWTDRAAIVWNTNDVHKAFNDEGRVLTEDTAIEILQGAVTGHDANYGVNWSNFRSIDPTAGRVMTKAEQTQFQKDNQPIIDPPIGAQTPPA